MHRMGRHAIMEQWQGWNQWQTDETARIVAQSLSNQLRQSFIVEDIGGAGAIIGSEKVARAVPDGYTLLVHNL